MVLAAAAAVLAAAAAVLAAAVLAAVVLAAADQVQAEETLVSVSHAVYILECTCFGRNGDFNQPK